ncbi:MAG: PAS domain S-box protein, partial [Lachnospiraceae bacterium]|nr:PAS domain S-box protein [Lachnospiraceae bacterium]
MFQNQFQIIIQSKSPEIEKTVHTIDLPEDSEVVLTTVADYHEIWKEDMIDTAVIIDGKTDDFPEISREKCLVVYLLSVDEMVAVKQEQLAKADMLWVMPGDRYQKDLLAIYYKKLLLFMKNIADNRKQKICFNTLIDSLPDLIWFKDQKGAHLIVNDGFCSTVEKTKEQIYKKGHYYIWDIPKEEYEQGDYVCLESEDIVMEARKTCLFDENVKTKGGMRLFKTYKSPLIDANEEIFGTCGFAHDVTELQNISQELAIVLKSLPFAVVIE